MQQTNYVIARNNRGLPIIVPLSAVEADLPPPSIIPTKDIIAVDDDGIMPVVQYEKNGDCSWCYQTYGRLWHYPLQIRIMHDTNTMWENVYRQIAVDYKAKKGRRILCNRCSDERH